MDKAWPNNEKSLVCQPIAFTEHKAFCISEEKKNN